MSEEYKLDYGFPKKELQQRGGNSIHIYGPHGTGPDSALGGQKGKTPNCVHSTKFFRLKLVSERQQFFPSLLHYFSKYCLAYLHNELKFLTSFRSGMPQTGQRHKSLYLLFPFCTSPAAARRFLFALKTTRILPSSRVGKLLVFITNKHAPLIC